MSLIWTTGEYMDRPYNYFTLKSVSSLIFDIEAWFKVTVYPLPTGKMWVNFIALKGILVKYTCTQVMSNGRTDHFWSLQNRALKRVKFKCHLIDWEKKCYISTKLYIKKKIIFLKLVLLLCGQILVVQDGTTPKSVLFCLSVQ